MNILRWIGDNILFVLTLFLLAFIPLYPKLPLLDVKNTWVYIRAEDFVVVFVLVVWIVLLLRKKITLRTPLTLPILLFWVAGAVATIHGALVVFPGVANVFPNVAFLSMLRRIEYLSVFFIAYSAMKDRRFLPYVAGVLAVTVLLVVAYGIGQKYLGFPAYLTMNEEFAKGLPIRLSALSRVPSTFGGHYDLAAYLVLIIPILTSMIFGLRNWLAKLILFGTVALGFGLLFMTVSRVSFFVLLLSLFLVFLFQKKRFALLSLPVIAILAFLILSVSPALRDRFSSTVKEVEVLVNANTGEAIGHPREVPSAYFENKVIMQDYVFKRIGELELATPAATLATPSGIIPYTALPAKVLLIDASNVSTGENLPQGTGYINLLLSPVNRRVGEYFYEQAAPASTKSANVLIMHGNFLIKKALAYDLSFTTRFQGEWPRAIEAFRRNILFGSGYSSISLAVDNNYLRILGETGLLGFASFLAIFITIGIYIRKALPHIDSPIVRSFALGFVAGVIGLALNGLLIDVFEASKIAFLLWLLTGVTLGTLAFYQKEHINRFEAFKKVATSTYAVIAYLCIVAVVLFSPMLGNFFVGDDFTWFRWVVEDSSIFRYFTESDGFFYRPGTKVYFDLMYGIFWLNQTAYHAVSLFLHLIVTVLVFLLAKKLLGDLKLSILASFIFLVLSGLSEAVFWISATGFLFNAVFTLLSLLFFILWEEKKKTVYFVGSLISMAAGLLFHELGVVVPLILLLYKFTTDDQFTLKSMWGKTNYLIFFLPILPYLLLRFIAGSHWFSGDYSYNLLKLPFNVVGNTIGFLFLGVIGPVSLPFYNFLREFLREQIPLAIIVVLVAVFVLIVVFRVLRKRLEKEDQKIVLFGCLFFIIALLPFLGLGNITSRYSYLASFGVAILLAFIVKKLYGFLQDQGRDIALTAVTAIIALFSLLHIVQIQQIHSDWYEAGEKVRRFIIAIDGVYDDYWAKAPMSFHFVNVPIRTGEAWVFPVGLSDAVYLVIRNPNIAVYQWQSAQQALETIAYGSETEKVFEFDETGGVLERKKIPRVQ